MQLDVHTTGGDILHYTTQDIGIERVAEGLEVASLSTTIITRDPSGTVTRRLRERYAPALLTAVWGVFEEPDGSGGWSSVLEFSLIDVRPSVVSPSEAVTSGRQGGLTSVCDLPRRFGRAGETQGVRINEAQQGQARDFSEIARWLAESSGTESVRID